MQVGPGFREVMSPLPLFNSANNQEPEAIKVKIIIVSEEPKKFCSLVHYFLFFAEELVAMVSI